jgi:hypothetical protein
MQGFVLSQKCLSVCASTKPEGAHRFLWAVLAGTPATACTVSEQCAICSPCKPFFVRIYAKLLLIPRLGT